MLKIANAFSGQYGTRNCEQIKKYNNNSNSNNISNGINNIFKKSNKFTDEEIKKYANTILEFDLLYYTHNPEAKGHEYKHE